MALSETCRANLYKARGGHERIPPAIALKTDGARRCPPLETCSSEAGDFVLIIYYSVFLEK